MNNQNEKKVVDVFRSFFDKMVLPHIRTNPRIMEEWKYLISIMTEETLDIHKLDLYITMLSHQKTNNNKFAATEPFFLHKPQPQLKQFSTSNNNDNFSNSPGRLDDGGSSKDAKEFARDEQKRKMAFALEGFHNSLMGNQERLESEFRRGRIIREPEDRKYM